MKKFNKFVDYYALLGFDRDTDKFCSAAELKAAYKKRSLELHPDKQLRKSPDEKLAAEEKFHQLQKAYDILTEPATRQAYDRARDKLEAEYEAGVVVNDDEATKPPPSCVDVSVSLEEMFEGCQKYVRYTRMMFEGTKWEKRTDDTFTLHVRPGELEGATFWFRNQGDVSTLGKADLVFVLVQQPHHLFERVGQDLWYRLPDPVPVERLCFTQFVPTLEGLSKKWVNNKLTAVGVYGQAVASGTCLAAALGCDRSGWGEAIVCGKGMPLLAEGEDVRRGSGEVEEREQLPGAQPAKSRPRAGGSQLPRGDLVAKFRLRLADRRYLPALAPGCLPMPPIGLLTTRSGEVSAAALDCLLAHTVLPAVVEHRLHRTHHGQLPSRHFPASMFKRLPERRKAPAAPRPCAQPPLPPAKPPLQPPLQTPHTPHTPHTPQRALLTKAYLEDLAFECLADDLDIDETSMCRWTEAQARNYFESGGLTRPAEEDLEDVEDLPRPAEEDLEPLTLATPRPIVDSSTMPALLPALLPTPPDTNPALEASPHEASGEGEAAGEVRAMPSLEPPLVAVCLRVGGEAGVSLPGPASPAAAAVMQQVRRALPQVEWRLMHAVSGVEQPLLPDEAAVVEATALLLVEAVRDDEGRPGQLVFDPRAGRLVPVEREPCIYVAAEGQAVTEEEEEEEEAVEEGDVIRRRAEAAYAAGGISLARSLWQHPHLHCVHRAHAHGAVILAIDQACSLMGRSALSTDAVSRSPLLPYLVGLAPKSDSPSGKLSWRRLRGVALRSGIEDCALGFAALGLPPGFVGAALTARGSAIRQSLGSAPARKLAGAEVRERTGRVRERQLARKSERDREKRIGLLQRFHVESQLPWPPAWRAGGPWADVHGRLRGLCRNLPY